jgi:hypothetical protein
MMSNDMEVAGATGLEPATSGVTGRRSNQLSYAPAGAAPPRAAGRRVRLREAPRQVKDKARAHCTAETALLLKGLKMGRLGFESGRESLPVGHLVVAGGAANPGAGTKPTAPREVVGGEGLEPPTSCV